MSDKTTCTSAGTGTPVTTQTICNRPFIAYEHGIGDPLDSFSKDKIEAQLKQRLNHASYPDQDRTSLCGPAAFFYCLLIAKPDLYKKAVEELWKTGKTSINQLVIDVPKQTRRPHSYFKKDKTLKILGIDWMTLGGLRGTSNTLLAYQSPDDDTAAITAPPILIEWFKKAGFSLVDKFILNNHINHKELNKYFNTNNYYIVSLVSSNILPTSSGPNLPNHWVVWTSQFKDFQGNMVSETTKPDDIVNMSVFSWGKRYMTIKPITYTVFKIRHHMALVFKG